MQNPWKQFSPDPSHLFVRGRHLFLCPLNKPELWVSDATSGSSPEPLTFGSHDLFQNQRWEFVCKVEDKIFLFKGPVHRQLSTLVLNARDLSFQKNRTYTVREKNGAVSHCCTVNGVHYFARGEELFTADSDFYNREILKFFDSTIIGVYGWEHTVLVVTEKGVFKKEGSEFVQHHSGLFQNKTILGCAIAGTLPLLITTTESRTNDLVYLAGDSLIPFIDEKPPLEPRGLNFNKTQGTIYFHSERKIVQYKHRSKTPWYDLSEGLPEKGNLLQITQFMNHIFVNDLNNGVYYRQQ